MNRKHIHQAQTLTIAGISVELIRKKIRHAYLRVKRTTGIVTVSAPYAMLDAAIARFVREKAGWIRRQLEMPVSRPSAAERTFAGGDTIAVWGRSYRLETRIGTRYAMELTGDTAILTAREGSTSAGREAFAREWYRALLKAAVPPLLSKWESATGLQAAGFRTKDMTTRWGSCNVKTGTLWFSLQLAKMPPERLDYVVLHELLHLAERGHNKRFYALLSRYMPDWKSIRAELNGRRPRTAG